MTDSTGPEADSPATPPIRNGGDPLAAMYVLAAVMMALGAIIIVGLMLVPRGWFSSSPPSEDVYVPGGGEAFTSLGQPTVSLGPVGLRELEPGKYLAVIEAYNWSFQPSEIRVPVGAEVTFRARSDQDYHGIAIIGTDVMISLTESQISEAKHVFSERGQYMWVCSEYCGAGHALMGGTIYVE